MQRDDDPVVQERDIFFCKSLDNLHLMQYPVRPNYLNYDEASFVSTKFKPIQQMVEMEIELNPESSTYDLHLGEQIAGNVDANSKEDEKYFKSNFMDKQVLRSKKAGASSSRYAIGCLKNGQLHITPLQSILHLRPTFDYLDRSDAKQRKENKESGDGEASSDEEKVTQQVTVKFANTDKDKAKKISEKSFRRHQQIMNEEPWIDVKLNQIDTETSKNEREKLMYQHDGRPSLDLVVNPKDYVQVLLPKETITKGMQSSVLAESLPMIQLKCLPLHEQVRAILKNVKVIEFSELMSRLSSNIDCASVLREVQDLSVLVQGCWVIRSDSLYSVGLCSSYSGISNEIIIRGRDYVLWSFTKNRYVNRKEMASATKLPPEDLNDILKSLAKRHLTDGWEFLLPTDSLFKKKYPQVVERQQKCWDQLFKNSLSAMNEVKEKKPNVEVRSRRTKSHRDSESDKVSHIDGGVRIKSEPFTNGNDNSLEFVATPAVLQELNSFVQEKLMMHYCVSISDLKRFLTQKLASSPPGHVLGRGISDKLLGEAAEAAGACLLNIKWPNNSEQESLYALTSRGDSNDQLRSVLFEMYKTNSKYRRKTIHKKIEDELKTSISEQLVDDLVKDYCMNNNGWYYLKGTLKCAI